jgi:hypothetical protein
MRHEHAEKVDADLFHEGLEHAEHRWVGPEKDRGYAEKRHIANGRIPDNWSVIDRY